MIVYVDYDFKCHVTDGGAMRPVVTTFFDGKCAGFIEGYRFIPEGESWRRQDGTVFTGRMIAPWVSYSELAKLQAEYEHEQLAAVTADRDKCLADMQELIDEVLGG